LKIGGDRHETGNEYHGHIVDADCDSAPAEAFIPGRNRRKWNGNPHVGEHTGIDHTCCAGDYGVAGKPRSSGMERKMKIRPEKPGDINAAHAGDVSGSGALSDWTNGG